MAVTDKIGLTSQFLLSQQRGVLQQAQRVWQTVGHNKTQCAALPQSQESFLFVSQESFCSLGNMQRHRA